MAFTSAVTKMMVKGHQRVHEGTFTSDGGSTGGDIDTGLSVCESIELQPVAAAVGTDQAVVNETLPVPGGAVTIVTIANQVGRWIARGR